MNRRLCRTAALLMLAALAVGCGSASSGNSDTAPSVTVTVTQSATPSSTPSATPSEATSPSPTGPAGPVACTTSALKASLGHAEGAMGSTYSKITLTNTGSGPCLIGGFGGVSYVGGEAGVQIGAPAVRDTSKPVSQILLQPGQAASAQLQEGEARNYPSSKCRPAKAQGLKIFPPDETEALYVRRQVTACSSKAVKLLQIQAYQKVG